jgi:integrase
MIRFNASIRTRFGTSRYHAGFEIGLPPETVQTLAGHSSLQVTLERHGHLFRSDRHKEAMDAIAAQLNEPGRPSLPLPTPPKTIFR